MGFGVGMDIKERKWNMIDLYRFWISWVCADLYEFWDGLCWHFIIKIDMSNQEQKKRSFGEISE